MAERVGVLGGTFDPPHVGHAVVAQDVWEQLELDRLLIIPTASPPHREAVLPGVVRLELTRALFRGATGLEVSAMELERAGRSYTVDTLERLRAGLDDGELFFVMGVDQLAVIDTWHQYRRLPGLATIAVMRRAGQEPQLPDAVADFAYIIVNVTRIDVSSTDVRQRLRAGRSIRYLVPEPIREQVEQAWIAHGDRAPA
jgi:nicotinate-nucleotide adenylyltransferase